MENKKHGQVSPTYPILPPTAEYERQLKGLIVRSYICLATRNESSWKQNPFKLNLVIPPGEQWDGAEHQSTHNLAERSVRIKLITIRMILEGSHSEQVNPTQACIH